MVLFTVSSKQLLLNSLFISVFTSILVITVNAFFVFYSLPQVIYNPVDNSCIKVINFQNGDAYNCHDVDVLLRKYRREAATDMDIEP